jgi:hypothetical protein
MRAYVTKVDTYELVSFEAEQDANGAEFVRGYIKADCQLWYYWDHVEIGPVIEWIDL